MRTFARMTLGLLAVSGLMISGCSDDDDDGASEEVSAEAAPYVEAMKENLTSSSDDTFQLTDDQVDCLAPRMVNVVGVDRFEEAGVTPESIRADDNSMDLSDLGLSESDGGKIYDSFGACDVDLRSVFMDGFASEGMPEEAQSCVEDALTDDRLRTFVVSLLVNGEDAMETDPDLGDLMGALMECG
jgi:hypothetical protein